MVNCFLHCCTSSLHSCPRSLLPFSLPRTALLAVENIAVCWPYDGNVSAAFLSGSRHNTHQRPFFKRSRGAMLFTVHTQQYNTVEEKNKLITHLALAVAFIDFVFCERGGEGRKITCCAQLLCTLRYRLNGSFF